MKGSWTAVLIDGSWYLVDVHWSSSHVSGGSSSDWLLLDDNGKIVKNPSREVNKKKQYYKYDERYFLMNPEEFIYTHFPMDSRWQLLARKVSIDEFMKMAYLKPPFFDCGLRLCNHKKCLIDAPDGVASIQLAMSNPRNHFRYRLWISNKGGKDVQSELFENVKLTRFVFMENRDGTMKCDITFPVAGKFKLNFYCRYEGLQGNSYHLVCAYVLTSAKAANNCKPLPKNPRSEWGPGYDLENAGLRPLTHKEGMIKAADGEAELRFEADSNVEILAHLHSDKKTKEDLKRYVLHRIEETEIVINVKVPEKDDYVLSVYAGRHNDKEAATLKSVCSYSISASKAAADPTPFPRVLNGRFGQIKNNPSTFEVKPVSHPSAFITAPDNGDQLNLTFDFTPPDVTEFMTALMFYQNNVETKLERYTFTEITEDGQAKIAARFPERGQYVLNLFGKNTQMNGEKASYTLAYSYLLRVDRATDPCSPFPVIHKKWTKLCKLVKPDISRPIIADSKVLFSVKIPNAVKVAVYKPDEVSNQWTYLMTDCDGLWIGEVTAGKAGDKLSLFAGFGTTSVPLSGLLEFQVGKLNLCQQQIVSCHLSHTVINVTIQITRKRKYLFEIVNGMFTTVLWH
jgi:hypothetical protein